MKLILYRYNLREQLGKWVHSTDVNIKMFPPNIQESAQHAKIVEFHNDDYIKVLKDDINPCREVTIKPHPDNFAQFVINNAQSAGFINVSFNTGRNGVEEIVLKRW